jgi:hypothetical protein
MPALESERDRVLAFLGENGPVLSPEDLPDEPGIYALWPTGQQSISDLGLEEVEGEPPLTARALYVGKDQKSVLNRVGGKTPRVRRHARKTLLGRTARQTRRAA